jgi:hypothetical protein
MAPMGVLLNSLTWRHICNVYKIKHRVDVSFQTSWPVGNG